MTLPQSFASVRSYYFRELVAEAKRGRPLDGFTLENFRLLWVRATAQAIAWERAITHRYDPVTRSWEHRR